MGCGSGETYCEDLGCIDCPPLIPDFICCGIKKLDNIPGDVAHWVKDEINDITGDVVRWYDDAKDVIKDIDKYAEILEQILNFDIFSYITLWISSIFGTSLEVAIGIAVVILVLVSLSILGGLIGFVRLFV